MKKIYKLLMVLIVVVLCTACGNRTAPTTDDFNEALSKYDITDVSDDYDFAIDALLVEGNKNMSLLFLNLKNDLTSRNMYIDEVKNVYAAASKDILSTKEDKTYQVEEDDIDKTITTGDNYSIVEVRTSTTYYRVAWIDNIFIYGKVDLKYKKDIIDIMKELNC